MSIYDAAMKYAQEGVPLVVLAGKEYGSGSSRDWAAKGTRLLGVRAVIAESYERIHRSNLVGMGVLPLQFGAGESVKIAGIDGGRDLRLSRVWLRPSPPVLPPAGRSPSELARADGAVREFRPIAHRYAAGSALLQARRNSAIRVAAIANRKVNKHKPRLPNVDQRGELAIE